MEIENRKSTFIRDLIVKVLLIVLFIFLLMYLFPMPNLNPFYDAVFNDNLQTMKEAAEKYYTTDRMPSEIGETSELTLQDMLDKKLVIPFVDKDGKSCDTHSSYVQVKKNKKEYVLKVSLTCGSQTDYIIDHIGCYNFCKDNKCAQASATEKVEEQTTPVNNVVNNTVSKTNVVPTTSYTPTPSNPTPKKYYCSIINGKYFGKGGNEVSKDTYTNECTTKTNYYCSIVNGKYFGKNGSEVSKDTYTNECTTPVKHYCEYYGGNYYDKNGNITSKDKYISDCIPTKTAKMLEYEKSHTSETWTLLDWQLEQMTETDDLKLVNTKTEYTGQKITSGITLYKHIKYAYKDNWTVDSDWSTDTKEVSDTVKLYASRTLYTGDKLNITSVEKYRHVKVTYNNNWTTTDWTTEVRQTGPNVVLLDTRYKVSKTTQNTSKKTVTKDTWSEWKKDTQWRTSKPADTSTRQWGSAWDSQTVGGSSSTTTSKVKLYDDYKSTVALASNSTYTYVFTGTSMDPCTSACNGQSTIRIYHYIVYKNETSTTTTPGTTQYRYYYRDKTTTTETIDEFSGQDTDTKWVSSKSELNKYISKGYMLVTTQYKYKINNVATSSAYTWTESITPPEGYQYTGQSTTQKIENYEPLNKWVVTKDKLGEYTYNITTVDQYKYKYNNPEKYILDTLWTESKNSPEGYIYTGQTKEVEGSSYVDLGKWVENKSDLKEYKYNIKVRKSYQYKKRTTSTFYDTTWYPENYNVPSDWKATGKSIEVDESCAKPNSSLEQINKCMKNNN